MVICLYECELGATYYISNTLLFIFVSKLLYFPCKVTDFSGIATNKTCLNYRNRGFVTI
jgi:hypothetical protein